MVDLINKTTEDLVKRFGIDVLWAYSETGKIDFFKYLLVR